jgi:hypothetical protein
MYKGCGSEEQKLQFLVQNSYLISKDQAGCRRIQKKIEELFQTNEELARKFAQNILTSLIPHTGELMTDSFANYLIQKLMKFATPEQIDDILIKVRVMASNTNFPFFFRSNLILSK